MQNEAEIDDVVVRAAKELLRRNEARASFAQYCRENGFEPARHHLLLCDKLEKVANGEIRRLMVFMPPGHAKSTYTSQLFPAWLQGQPSPRERENPELSRDNNPTLPWDILACSHGADLAGKFSKRTRGVVTQNEDLMGFGLSPQTKAADRWETTAGDAYRAAGVGSGIAGERADVGIIDDPVSGKKQAESALDRETRWEWYLGDFRMRLKPQAAIIIVQTRWHEDDLSGRILPDEWNGESGLITAKDGEEWEVVCFTAICDRNDDPLDREIGEALWPEYIPLKNLLQEKRTQTVRNFEALFQQNPKPAQGNYFKTEWTQVYDELPKGCRFYLTTDWATTDEDDSESHDPDYTCHQVWAVDREIRLYLVDMWRGRKETDEGADRALDLVGKWKPVAWIYARGPIDKAVTPLVRTFMKQRNLFVPLESYSETMDKETKALTVQGYMSAGMIFFPRPSHANTEWLSDFRMEVKNFPAGRHDDQVDAMSMLGLHLDKVIAPPTGAVSGYAQDDNTGVDW